MEKSIIFECKSIEEKLITMRHELHKCPEIGGDLPKNKGICM